MLGCRRDSIAPHSSYQLTQKVFDGLLFHQLGFQDLDGHDGLAPLGPVDDPESALSDLFNDFDLLEIDLEVRLEDLLLFETPLELGDHWLGHGR